jgi:hypothetical protein
MRKPALSFSVNQEVLGMAAMSAARLFRLERGRRFSVCALAAGLVVLSAAETRAHALAHDAHDKAQLATLAATLRKLDPGYQAALTRVANVFQSSTCATFKTNSKDFDVFEGLVAAWAYRSPAAGGQLLHVERAKLSLLHSMTPHASVFRRWVAMQTATEVDSVRRYSGRAFSICPVLRLMARKRWTAIGSATGLSSRDMQSLRDGRWTSYTKAEIALKDAFAKFVDSFDVVEPVDASVLADLRAPMCPPPGMPC